MSRRRRRSARVKAGEAALARSNQQRKSTEQELTPEESQDAGADRKFRETIEAMRKVETDDTTDKQTLAVRDRELHTRGVPTAGVTELRMAAHRGWCRCRTLYRCCCPVWGPCCCSGAANAESDGRPSSGSLAASGSDLPGLAQRARPRRNRFTIASNTIAPSNEITSPRRLKLPSLMVLPPTSGVISQPASNAPMIPTMMFRNIPCCALVRMIMLAIQPMIPPTISQSMKFIVTPLASACHP